MMGQKFGMLLERFWEYPFECFGYSGMQLLTLAAQQSRVDSILYKTVFEDKYRIWRYASAKREAARYKILKRCIKRFA
jgi:hypothetical protein